MLTGTFSHGIHVPEAKERTAGEPIKRFPFPPFLILFLSQHLGKPSVPTVREGQEVMRGELIARADGFMSVPIHAPADGKVVKVGLSMDMNGKMSPAIFLEPFPASGQQIYSDKPRDVNKMSSAELVQAIQDTGMVGLGGAAFPTHVKFSLTEKDHIDTLIVNGCECEPYLTSDHRVMLEFAKETLLGVELCRKACGAERAMVGIEDNKPDAIALLQKELSGMPELTKVSINPVKTKYPQGAEKMLTKALLNREIPPGALPKDIGVLVSNVATMAEMGTLVPLGRGLFERVVTLSGTRLNKPGNYIIPIGTPLNFILDYVEISKGKLSQIVFGGPMMGKAVSFLETPITKGVSGILALDSEELADKDRETFPCIKCGECLRACPIHLNPSQMGLMADAEEFDMMKDQYNLLSCFECGCCSYVCPSYIPLVQKFRSSKAILRSRQVKQ